MALGLNEMYCTLDQSDSSNKLDFAFFEHEGQDQPTGWVEVKEKRQPIGKRWHKHTDVQEPDLFIMDELTVRRATGYGPEVWFLIRDVPGGNRLFVAGLWELVAVPRTRVVRDIKGKLLYDLNNFQQVGSLEDLGYRIRDELISQPWKMSGCAGMLEVPQV